MSEFSWPGGPGVPTAEEIHRSWKATVSALPVGARVSGRVIGRQRFGVFLLLDGVPNAMGLAEIAGMPLDYRLPALGTVVAGEVVWHAEHNCQVRIKLDEPGD